MDKPRAECCAHLIVGRGKAICNLLVTYDLVNVKGESLSFSFRQHPALYRNVLSLESKDVEIQSTLTRHGKLLFKITGFKVKLFARFNLEFDCALRIFPVCPQLSD